MKKKKDVAFLFIAKDIARTSSHLHVMEITQICVRESNENSQNHSVGMDERMQCHGYVQILKQCVALFLYGVQYRYGIFALFFAALFSCLNDHCYHCSPDRPCQFPYKNNLRLTV